jgi:hypothetical protein
LIGAAKPTGVKRYLVVAPEFPPAVHRRLLRSG